MPSHLAQSTAIALIAGTLFQLTPTMTLAEEKPKVDWAFELTYEGDQRRSLGDGQGDHLTKLTPQVTVEIEHELADDVTGYIELEFGHDRILDYGWRRSEDHESALDLKQFYLKFEEIRDLPPGGPSLMTRVRRLDFGIGLRRISQARRARSPQPAQASGARLPGSGCSVPNAA